MTKDIDRAIGVFDSGVGGLTVVKALQELMPHENIVYIGDTARVPYGNKSKKSIIEFSVENVMFLLDKKVKSIVVACNTASAIALDELRSRFKVPIIGVIEAGAKKAAESAQDGKIGVIGTYRTVKSAAYEEMIKQHSPRASVISKACPLFVPLIEENFQDSDAARLIIKEYLDGMSSEIDTLILGCTHYPLIKPAVAALYPEVRLIDSADSVAVNVESKLSELELRKYEGSAVYEYFATDLSENFIEIARRILKNENIDIKEIHL